MVQSFQTILPLLTFLTLEQDVVDTAGSGFDDVLANQARAIAPAFQTSSTHVKWHVSLGRGFTAKNRLSCVTGFMERFV